MIQRCSIIIHLAPGKLSFDVCRLERLIGGIFASDNLLGSDLTDNIFRNLDSNAFVPPLEKDRLDFHSAKAMLLLQDQDQCVTLLSPSHPSQFCWKAVMMISPVQMLPWL